MASQQMILRIVQKLECQKIVDLEKNLFNEVHFKVPKSMEQWEKEMDQQLAKITGLKEQLSTIFKTHHKQSDIVKRWLILKNPGGKA
jgi:hypothetical protein